MKSEYLNGVLTTLLHKSYKRLAKKLACIVSKWEFDSVKQCTFSRLAVLHFFRKNRYRIPPMDYSAILQALNQASLFDLHRLQSAIYQELQNPKRIDQIKAQLNEGQLISYFDPQTNSLIDAVVEKVQRTRCLVKNTQDQKSWNIPFYYLNLDNVATDIQPAKNTVGLSKSTIKVGMKVGFRDRGQQDQFGTVIRLNPKTATVKAPHGKGWLVPYSMLFQVIEGEVGDYQEQMFIPHDPN